MDFSQRLHKWMEPVWRGSRVTDECVLFTRLSEGQPVRPCRLLFKPDKILEVRSDYLDIVFEEGRDYRADNGEIALCEGSRIPFFDYDELFLREPASIPIKSVHAPGRYVRYEAEGVETIKRQVKVTYIHKEECTLSLPGNLEAFLPRTLYKLVHKQPLKIVFYGDSFMAGCDASGRTGLAPYMPQLDRLTAFKLAERYKHSKIHCVNTAVGGTTSQWGLENLQSRVLDLQPDLTVLRFGVNDCSSGTPAAVCAENMHAMAHALRNALHPGECLIMTCDLPSEDCDGWMGTNGELEAALDQRIENEERLAILHIKTLYEQIRAIKGYYSLTTNFVNHPNDFMIRLYAQLLCSALGVYSEVDE